MPVCYDKILDDSRIGIWRINESYEKLHDIIKLTAEEKAKLESFKNQQRKMQFLGTRALLKHFENENVRIQYDNDGSPKLSNGKHISISHSKDVASIIISNTNVGIDIEYIDQKILKILTRFLTDKEIKEISKDDLALLFLYWGAKESMVKITKNKSYIYNKDLEIKPFVKRKKGSFTGRINHQKKILQINFGYEILDKVVLVWCISSV